MALHILSVRKEPIVTEEALPLDFVVSGNSVKNIQQPPLAAALTDAPGANGHTHPEMLIGSSFEGLRGELY